MLLLRAFSTTSRTLYTATPLAIEKSALAKLRKSTGYSFSKCKEALQKHDNNLKQAEEWLKVQAQAHGWEKATKLQGRTTAQGLISIISSPSNAVMLETNCETDFVARNKKFQSLVNRITQGSFQFSKEQENAFTSLNKLPLTGDELSNLPLISAEGSRPVKDEVALGIGEVGENIKTRRGVCFQAPASASVVLAGYTHPTPAGLQTAEVQHGKYGAVVAFKSTKSAKSPLSLDSINLIGRQLCQHIVGMNPKEIGSMEDIPEYLSRRFATETTTRDDSSESVEGDGGTKTTPLRDSESELDEDSIKKPLEPEVDERTLLNQEFLLDPDMTVRDFLLQNSIEVVDFVRYEVGEVIEVSHLE